MKQIRVAAAALNQTPLDWSGNIERIKTVIREAYAKEVDILCLPELCITGYGCEDAFFSQSVLERAYNYLFNIGAFIKELVSGSERRQLTVCVGLPLSFNNAIYNVIAVLQNASIIGFVPKQNLAADGVHYESRWFKAWPKGETSIVNDVYPIGDLIFDLNRVKFSFEICEDSWIAERKGADLALNGVDIILNPSASHFAFDKHETRKRLVLEGSRAFRCTYVYSNLLGNEAGRIIYEGDTFIASGGKLIASGKRLSFKDYILTTAVVDIDHTRTLQAMNGAFHPNVGKSVIPLVRTYNFFNNSSKQDYDNIIEKNELNKYEQFSRAVSLGLFDYARKSNTKGFVVSLSGGADSTAVSCLVRLMCDYGIEELSIEKFTKKLNLPPLSFKADIMKNLLTCVYQGTKNSSERTFESASTVAGGIGATFLYWNLDDVINTYSTDVKNALNIDLDWNKDNIAMQNIQARARVPGIWMLANIKNALLLATSNRSEAAVGYTTIDGDMCGCLNIIGGIDKAFLLDWLNNLYNSDKSWANRLELVTKIQPSAELKPLYERQTDEQDLMPYSILDAIERAAIRDKKMPKEVLAVIEENFSDYNKEILKEYVKKFFRLWTKNQFKREKMAPSFHLDDENLDPKTWCRWPILCGSFENELNEL